MCKDRQKCLKFLNFIIQSPNSVDRKKVTMLHNFIEKNYKSFDYIKSVRKSKPTLYALTEIVKQNIKLKVFLQSQVITS